MGVQTVTMAEYAGVTAALTTAINALTAQVVMLMNQMNNHANNNNNNNNRNNQNRVGGTIRVRGGNNQIIDSTILSLNSLLFDADNTTKLQAKDKTVANSISKINMETENPNEIAELQSEVERMNALTTTEKLKSEFFSKASVQYETKVQESQKALAGATFYARTQAIEAALYAKKKEAEGIVTLENAQGVYLSALVNNYTSVRGYLMINGGMFQEIAKINAEVVHGLEPKFSIWNNGGDNSVATGELKDAFPSWTWAITFLNWYKGKCYIFQIKPSLHFTEWDQRGWSLVHWRSQHVWEALYQNENSGSSSSEVEETDVGGFH